MKRRGNLAQSYNLKKKNLGGLFGKNPDGTVDTRTVGAAAGMGAGFVNAIDPGNEYGVQSTAGAGLSGALSGAAAGAALGPPGIIGGAVIGGITSLISNGAKADEQEYQEGLANRRFNEKVNKDIANKIAINPLLLGDPNATMYRRGGTIKGQPAGKFALQGTLLGKYRGVRSSVPSVAIKPNRMMESGGIIPTDTQGRAVIEGPSHDNGGVKVPELGIELEGGETLDGDFVFSKELGFADKHKKIMKAMESTKKDTTPLSRSTYDKLAQQEEKLKGHQESLKRQLGEENEIDNTAEEMKNINKTVSFKDQKGLVKKALGGKVKPLEELTPSRPTSLSERYNSLAPQNLPIRELPNVPSATIGNTDSEGTGATSVIEKVAPFASNLVNAFRKLPAVPTPILNDSTAPNYVNYGASRNEAVRAVRGANKLAESQLSSSNATAAVNAANLVSGIRAVNEVNQAENNTNTQIANRTIERNQEVARENNAKLEYAQAQNVSRSLKQQELNSENLANFADKIQLQTRDRNLRSLEDDKLMLQIAQDNTGASWRAGKEIFKRRLTPESFKALDERMNKLEQMNEEERMATIEALRAGVSSLGVSGANTPSVLVNSSTSKKKK